jgi:hypothetical protein
MLTAIAENSCAMYIAKWFEGFLYGCACGTFQSSLLRIAAVVLLLSLQALARFESARFESK